MGVKIDIQKKVGSFHLDIRFQSEASRIGILGASGCGKSMTLKSIAGIELPDQGQIELDGKVVYSSKDRIHIRPQERSVGYLFQNYALFPTMTVEKNITAGVKGSKSEKEARVREMVRRFRLEGLEKRLPGELSGGQQQRVALARIMAYEPEVILLDEPFSALDMFLRDHLQRELETMLADYQGTVILVSHNRDEIYRFCEDLLIIDQGKAVIAGRTEEVFEDPKKVAAARLTGCKNISGIRRIDAHTMYATDWGVELHTARVIDEEITHVGFRAHEFLPVWGERRENCIRVKLSGSASLPFEMNYYLQPEIDTESAGTPVCWFVQKERQKLIREKGMPDYLQFPEAQLLLLRA